MCYCSYTWATELIREVFYLDISCICWFRVFWCVIWNLNSCLSWWSRRQWARRCHNGSCTDTVGCPFEHITEICWLSHWWSLFMVKSKTCLGNTLFKCWIMRVYYRNFAVCVCVCLFLKQNDTIKQCDNYKYDICALLGFYSVLIGNFLGMFWDNQLVPSPRVKQLTLNVGTGRRTVVTVGDMTQVPYWGCTVVQWPVRTTYPALPAGHTWTNTRFYMWGEKGCSNYAENIRCHHMKFSHTSFMHPCVCVC